MPFRGIMGCWAREKTGPRGSSARAGTVLLRAASFNRPPLATQLLSPRDGASRRLRASLGLVRWDTRRVGCGELRCTCVSKTSLLPLAWSCRPELALIPPRWGCFPTYDWFSISTLQETENTANLISMKAMNLPGQVIIPCPSEIHLLPQGHSEWTTGSYEGLGKIIRRNPAER